MLKLNMFTAPQIMGILNVTPDSFSDGGKFDEVDRAVAHARKLIADGADILDIGGESTRPGAKEICVQEEISRTAPVIRALRAAGIEAQISIDTRKPDVAVAAIKAGANIWNDVSALTFDPRSEAMAADLGCPVILMHAQGLPETMQDNPQYEDVVRDIIDWLEGRIDAAVRAGVIKSNIIIDPGIGFGKRHEDNLSIFARLDDFHALGCPILMGASRKSFIGRIDGSDAETRLGGSLASALWSAALGADILRVHDVSETAQAVKVWEAMANGNA